jgi:hypothetical protein
VFNPCTRKSANMGHPSRGKACWEAGKAEDEMKVNLRFTAHVSDKP